MSCGFLILTYFSRSQGSKFNILLSGGKFRYYLTESAVIWCDDVSRHSLYLRQISIRLDSNYDRQGTLVKCKSSVSEILMISMVINLSLYVNLMRFHHIILHTSVFTDLSRS